MQFGACGMGGPTLVLWAVNHNWPAEKMRGFLFTVFAASIPIQIVLLYFTFGLDIFRATITALLLAPVVFLGTAIGLSLGNALLAAYGKKKISDNRKESELSPIDCPRCKENNEYGNIFCKKCGWALDMDADYKFREKRKKADEVINRLTKDPESLKLLARAMAKLRLVDKLMEI